MIIFLLILCVLGFAYTNVFGRKVWHKFCMVIFGLGFLASLSLIVLNDKDHFGMTEVTQDKTFELKSSSASKDGPNMLLYQPLGDGSEKVYLYNTPDKKKLQKTGTENVTNTVQKDAQKATLVQKRRNGPIKSLGPKHYLALLTTITNLQNKKTPSMLLVTG